MVYGIKNMGELKCVWTSTGDVGEKLCDKKFECENCEFDKQMRSSKSPGNIKEFYLNPDFSLIDEVIHKLSSLKNISYPPGYKFSNTLLLKKFLGETHFLGLNPVLNVLFDNITTAEIFGSGARYLEGENIFDIRGEWGNYVITAPFELTFESEIIPPDSNSEGRWIGFVKCNEDNVNAACLSKEQYAKSIDNVCRNLKKYTDKSVTVGTTMYDGGERLKYIYQIIGKENYLKILTVILS